MPDPLTEKTESLLGDITAELEDLRGQFFGKTIDKPTDPEGVDEQEEVQHYPGSKRLRRAVLADAPAPTTVQEDDEEFVGWDANPQVHFVNGEPKEFFTIGALAEALNRKPVTIRSWEAKGVFPKARFRTPGEKGRRLYTRAQVEGVIKAAAEEGLMDPEARKPITEAFTRKVVEVWKQ